RGEEDALGETQEAYGSQRKALADPLTDPRGDGGGNVPELEGRATDRALAQERTHESAHRKSGRAQEPRPRDVDTRHERADDGGGHEAKTRQLRDPGKQVILRLREARVVERVDAPCIHGAVAEGRSHRL